MITATGYSKDPNIVPEGVVVTFGRAMIEEQGGAKMFLSYFEECMSQDNVIWHHKCKNRPQYEIDHVYIIVLNRLYCRCYFGGFESATKKVYTADNKEKIISWSRILLAGPIVKPPPPRRVLKGFQGFRYCTKLF